MKAVMVEVLSALVLLLVCGCAPRGPQARVVASPIPEAERVWQPSYVVLYGRDRGAPDVAPAACQPRGELEVAEVGSGKVYDGDAFRRGAQELGANGVTQFSLITREGDERVVHAFAVLCPWPGITP